MRVLKMKYVSGALIQIVFKLKLIYFRSKLQYKQGTFSIFYLNLNFIIKIFFKKNNFCVFK